MPAASKRGSGRSPSKRAASPSKRGSSRAASPSKRASATPSKRGAPINSPSKRGTSSTAAPQNAPPKKPPAKKPAAGKKLNKQVASLPSAVLSLDPSGELSVAEQLRVQLHANAITVMALFKEWDADKSASVSREEFHSGVAALGFSAGAEDVDRVFESFDADHSGSIEFGEVYHAAATSRHQTHTPHDNPDCSPLTEYIQSDMSYNLMSPIPVFWSPIPVFWSPIPVFWSPLLVAQARFAA